jgi:type 1 fimbriae regulatory protein FimB/type 1 fimbriae regulatory protein FimE
MHTAMSPASVERPDCQSEEAKTVGSWISDLAKNGMPSVHPLTGIELRALRRLQREQKPGRYVFMSERGAPMSAVAFRRMLTRLRPAAKMPFPIHPHMLRHSTGFKLANQGVDTRSLQHYLGHKNIQHTVRYSELSPDRFRDFWKD